jgi:hypothetical protein
MLNIISQIMTVRNNILNIIMELQQQTPHQFFRPYNANPWKKNLPDCAVRAVSLAINMPYVDVCRRLGVSFKRGHGLIRDSGVYLQKIKDAFDDYFDIVVDFYETLPPEDIPDVEYDTAALFADDDVGNTEQTLVQWMLLNRGSGLFIVGLHSPETGGGAHLVCASTNSLKFFDTWDCSDWRVDAWLRVKKRER